MRLTHYINEAKEMLKQWKKYISTNKELAAGVDVLTKINKAGFRAYFVGGMVRDIILGLPAKDVDIATNMDMNKLSKMFKVHDIGKSRDFGIVVVNHKGFKFEIAEFRSDGVYKDGRRPTSVTFNVELETDLSRRDLTVNAMAIDKDGRIIDKFDGKKDIQNKILRTVGNPYDRFSEDFLRIMRVPRFAAKLGFEIDKETTKAIQKLSPSIQDLSPERLREELIKAASQTGDKFAKYIQILADLKLLRFILPEVMNLKNFRENLLHHPETHGYVRKILN